MSTWIGSSVPPGAGPAPLPTGVPEPPAEEVQGADEAQDRIRWAEAAALADRHRSDDELRRDADETRERISTEVAELRHKFGFDHEGERGGTFATARRHPFTAAAAAAGICAAAALTWRMARRRRHGIPDIRVRSVKAWGAKRHLATAGRELMAAADNVRPRRRSGPLKRLMHR